MDIIKVGLDFGTHQTKICIKTYPDEDSRHPRFEFFTFKDLRNRNTYFLPSEVQINKNGTLSYGYVSKQRRKEEESTSCPRKDNTSSDISHKANDLYKKYARSGNSIEDISVLVTMLSAYEAKNRTGKVKENYFKYFKQATFSEREWPHAISCENISIWYLSYIIFLLEERFGTDFSINMGIPVGQESYTKMREYATTLLLSAYHLVEDIYKNDLKLFLNEKIDKLLEKTEIRYYTPDRKNDYNIHIFPEAFASLNTLTSSGKLSNGMSLIVDIGGGTTDISFFTINQNKPLIFRYWSIPKGLNYIAEASGFSYKEGMVSKKAKKGIIEKFLTEENTVISELLTDLFTQLKQKTTIPKTNLINALQDRIIVYNGGGSTEKELVRPIFYFTDTTMVDADMWKETDMSNKTGITHLCQLLTTAYGLSLCDSDEEVIISEFTQLFKGLESSSDTVEEKEYLYNDKDKC